jgi:hypothetical protein
MANATITGMRQNEGLIGWSIVVQRVNDNESNRFRFMNFGDICWFWRQPHISIRSTRRSARRSGSPSRRSATPARGGRY